MQSNTIFRLGALVLATGFIAGSALAQAPEDKGPPDGKGQRRGPSSLDQLFVAADKNQDGFLDAKEFQAILPPGRNAETMIKPLDRNSDGKLSAAEFQKYGNPNAGPEPRYPTACARANRDAPGLSGC
jgi:hypothetical protein